MKKLILFSFSIIAFASLIAQTQKIVIKPVLKPKSIFKNLNDSASYAIGISIGGFCKQQGITAPNMEMISKSFSDVMENKTTWMSEQASNNCINKLLTKGQTTSQPAPKPADSTSAATNDTVSYAIGLNHAAFFRQQGITKLDTTFIIRAVYDVLGNKPRQFDDRIANTVMNGLIIRLQEEKVKPTIDAGRAFLAKNKKNPKIKTTASGLQYEIIHLGKGIKPAKADTFVCNYKGTLIDGTEFDNSYKRNEPLVYPLTSVIRGWTEGLQLMPVGSKFNLYIPYDLAYGPFDNNAIPGGSVLIFEMELLDVKKSSATPVVTKPVIKPTKPKPKN